MTDKYDFDPKRGHSTAMNARGIAPRPITDAEMREAVARNEDRIRGYGGEYGSPAPPDAETPRERELWDALEEFALARHHATADEGAIVPRIPESAVRLVKAHDRIVELFARCGAANSLARGQRPGGPAHPSVAAPPDDRGREIGRQGEGAPPDYDELADAYSRQIEHTNRVRAAYQERCRALDERIAALVRERDELRKAAETALWAWGTSLNIGDDRLIQALEALRAALTPPEARADDQ
jgi:hypothetical protein